MVITYFCYLCKRVVIVVFLSHATSNKNNNSNNNSKNNIRKAFSDLIKRKWASIVVTDVWLHA